MNRWLLSFSILILLVSNAQATEPADSNIKAAIYDIDKYQKSTANIDPKRKANIKRALNMLELARQRLDGSQNKSHASWIDADKRLLTLQERLQGLLSNTASNTMDSKLSSAVAAIASLQTNVSQQPPGDRTAAKVNMSRLKQIESLLRSTQSKQHSKYAEVVTQYNALNQEIIALSKKPAQQQTTTQPEIKPASTAAIETDTSANTQPATDTKSNVQQTANVGPLPSWAKAKIGRFERNIMNTRQSIEEGGAKSLQNQQWVNELQRKIDLTKHDLNKLELPNQPEIIRILGIVEETQQIFNQLVANAKEQLNSLGDFQGELAKIDNYLKANPLPEALRLPFDDVTAQTFVSEIRNAMAMSQKIGQYLQHISVNADLERKGYQDGDNKIYGREDINRLMHWGVSKRTDNAKALQEQTSNTLLHQAGSIMNEMVWIENRDPNDRNHRANNFLGAGQYDQMIARIQEKLTNMKSISAYEIAINPEGQSRKNEISRISNAIEAYKEKYIVAKKMVRMPKPNSTDSTLIQIAKDTLAKDKYDVYPIAKLVVNSDIRKKEEKTADIESGVVNSTVTIYHYKWDEFQVATAENVDGTYYIYFSTLKYYYSGGPTTPTDRWILSDRFQSTEIPEENIEL